MKILVIRFSSAGDILLTSLFVRTLRTRFPEAEIHYMTKQQFAPLLEYSPHLNQLITIDEHWGIRELARLKETILRENRGDYDLIFDLHNSLRSRYVRFGLGRETAVIRKPTLAKQLLVRRKINRLRPIVPIPERYLAVGEPYGLKNDGRGLELFLGNTYPPITAAEDRPTIALAPGARHATKRWPPEYFTEIGRYFAAEKNAVVVLLGSGEERSLCGEIALGIPGRTVNLAGRATLLESAAALDACDLVISNDSAVAHLAAARKRPVIALFGSTVQEFGFAPYGSPARVAEVEGLPCRPCTTIGRAECPEGHFRCMKDLTPETVLKECRLLENEQLNAGD